MIGIRVFVFVASAMLAGPAILVACAEDDARVSFIETPDEIDASEASLLPLYQDADSEDADAAARSPADYDASDEPVVCTSTPCVTELAAGDRHFCALLSNGSIRCWGDDSKGQLGRGEIDGADNASYVPVPVSSVTNVTQISAGGNVTCARSVEGRVQCWGDNARGQLGLQASPALADSSRHPTPADVALTNQVARVDVGPSNVCALGTNGKVHCWGANESNQLARPDAGNIGGPDLADLRGYDILRVGAGLQSVFGLTKDGQLVGWGSSWGRETSISSSSPFTLIPVRLPTLTDVTSFAIEGSWPLGISGRGRGHVCAIAGGSVYCWGGNSYGQLGTGVPPEETLPTLATGMRTNGMAFPQQVAVSVGLSCVRMTDGTIRCCGNNERGALGRGMSSHRGQEKVPSTSVFSRATAFEKYAVQVAVSSRAVCALVRDGKVVCWGGNDEGQLGLGTRDTEPHLIPLTVVFE